MKLSRQIIKDLILQEISIQPDIEGLSDENYAKMLKLSRGTPEDQEQARSLAGAFGADDFVDDIDAYDRLSYEEPHEFERMGQEYAGLEDEAEKEDLMDKMHDRAFAVARRRGEFFPDENPLVKSGEKRIPDGTRQMKRFFDAAYPMSEAKLRKMILKEMYGQAQPSSDSFYDRAAIGQMVAQLNDMYEAPRKQTPALAGDPRVYGVAPNDMDSPYHKFRQFLLSEVDLEGHEAMVVIGAVLHDLGFRF